MRRATVAQHRARRRLLGIGIALAQRLVVRRPVAGAAPASRRCAWLRSRRRPRAALDVDACTMRPSGPLPWPASGTQVEAGVGGHAARDRARLERRRRRPPAGRPGSAPACRRPRALGRVARARPRPPRRRPPARSPARRCRRRSPRRPRPRRRSRRSARRASADSPSPHQDAQEHAVGVGVELHRAPCRSRSRRARRPRATSSPSCFSQRDDRALLHRVARGAA